MTAPASATRRIYLIVDSPHEVANWRPLVNWVLYIPHAIVLWVLQFAAEVLFLLYWLVVIVTGRPNRGLYGVMVLYERYNARATGFLLGYTEQYAPFDFDMGTTDNGVFPPIRLDLPEPLEEVDRTKALNVFLAIPHYLVFMLFGIGAFVALVVAWFAVLFTGRWPEGLRAFVIRVANYYYRIWAYVVMAENEYPRFGLPAA